MDQTCPFCFDVLSPSQTSSDLVCKKRAQVRSTYTKPLLETDPVLGHVQIFNTIPEIYVSFTSAWSTARVGSSTSQFTWPSTLHDKYKVGSIIELQNDAGLSPSHLATRTMEAGLYYYCFGWYPKHTRKHAVDFDTWPETSTPTTSTVLDIVQVVSFCCQKGDRVLIKSANSSFDHASVVIACYLIYAYNMTAKEVTDLLVQTKVKVSTRRLPFVSLFETYIGYLRTTFATTTTLPSFSLSEFLLMQRKYLHGHQSLVFKHVPKLIAVCANLIISRKSEWREIQALFHWPDDDIENLELMKRRLNAGDWHVLDSAPLQFLGVLIVLWLEDLSGTHFQNVQVVDDELEPVMTPEQTARLSASLASNNVGSFLIALFSLPREKVTLLLCLANLYHHLYGSKDDVTSEFLLLLSTGLTHKPATPSSSVLDTNESHHRPSIAHVIPHLFRTRSMRSYSSPEGTTATPHTSTPHTATTVTTTVSGMGSSVIDQAATIMMVLSHWVVVTSLLFFNGRDTGLVPFDITEEQVQTLDQDQTYGTHGDEEQRCIDDENEGGDVSPTDKIWMEVENLELVPNAKRSRTSTTAETVKLKETTTSSEGHQQSFRERSVYDMFYLEDPDRITWANCLITLDDAIERLEENGQAVREEEKLKLKMMCWTKQERVRWWCMEQTSPSLNRSQQTLEKQAAFASLLDLST